MVFVNNNRLRVLPWCATLWPPCILSGDNLKIDIGISSKPQLFFDCMPDKIFFISETQVGFTYSAGVTNQDNHQI